MKLMRCAPPQMEISLNSNQVPQPQIALNHEVLSEAEKAARAKAEREATFGGRVIGLFRVEIGRMEKNMEATI